MNNDNLLDHLVGDLKPLKPTPCPIKSSILLNIIIVSLAFASLYFLGHVRETFFSQLMNLRFSLELLSGFGALVFCSMYTFALSIPGCSEKFYAKMSLLFLILFYGSLISSIFFPIFEPSSLGANPHCKEAINIGIGLGLISIVYWSFKGVVLKSFAHSLGIIIYSMTLPILLMHSACMYHPEHTFNFHLTQVLSKAVLLLPLCFFYLSRKRI